MTDSTDQYQALVERFGGERRRSQPRQPRWAVPCTLEEHCRWADSWHDARVLRLVNEVCKEKNFAMPEVQMHPHMLGMQGTVRPHRGLIIGELFLKEFSDRELKAIMEHEMRHVQQRSGNYILQISERIPALQRRQMNASPWRSKAWERVATGVACLYMKLFDGMELDADRAVGDKEALFKAMIKIIRLEFKDIRPDLAAIESDDELIRTVHALQQQVRSKRSPLERYAKHHVAYDKRFPFVFASEGSKDRSR